MNVNFLCHLDNTFYEWQLRTQEGKRRGRKQQFKQRSDGGWRGPGSEFPGVEATDYELEISWVLGDDDRGQKEGTH